MKKNKKKNKIYVVTMKRWGDENTHSYVHYAGHVKHKAIKAGVDEKEFRGGKYESEVMEFIPEIPGSQKQINSSQ